MNKRFGLVMGALLAIAWIAPVSAHGFHGTASEGVTAVFAVVVALGITFGIRSIGHARLSLTQYVVVALGLITALVHVLLGARLGGTLNGLLLLSGVAYLLLLGALFIPLRSLVARRRPAFWGLIALAALNIVAFFVVHPWGRSGEAYELLGLGTKLVELLLIGALWIDGRARWRRPEVTSQADTSPFVQTQAER